MFNKYKIKKNTNRYLCLIKEVGYSNNRLLFFYEESNPIRYFFYTLSPFFMFILVVSNTFLVLCFG